MLEIGELDRVGRTDMTDAEIAALTLNQIVGHIAGKYDTVVTTLPVGRVAGAAMEEYRFVGRTATNIITVRPADMFYAGIAGTVRATMRPAMIDQIYQCRHSSRKDGIVINCNLVPYIVGSAVNPSILALRACIAGTSDQCSIYNVFIGAR